MLFEEVEARRQRLHGVRAGGLAELLDELVAGFEDVVPREEGLGGDGEVLADLLAARGHDAVHEHGCRAELVEGIDERLRHGGVVAGVLRGLRGIAPALVGGA